MEQLIETLATSQLTWATASVIIAVVLRPVLIAIVEIWKSNLEAKRTLEADRLENEKVQTDVLSQLKDELVVNRGIQNQLFTSVTAIPETLRTLQDTMARRVGEADRKRDAIHTDVKTIPTEVWRMGDPRLDNLREFFSSVFKALESNIMSQLDPKAQNARAAVREELATNKTEMEKIVKRLDEVIKTLNNFPPPTTPFSALPGGKKKEEKDDDDEAADQKDAA